MQKCVQFVSLFQSDMISKSHCEKQDLMLNPSSLDDSEMARYLLRALEPREAMYGSIIVKSPSSFRAKTHTTSS